MTLARRKEGDQRPIISPQNFLLFFVKGFPSALLTLFCWTKSVALVLFERTGCDFVTGKLCLVCCDGQLLLLLFFSAFGLSPRSFSLFSRGVQGKKG